MVNKVSKVLIIILFQLLLNSFITADHKVEDKMEQLLQGSILLDIIDQNGIDGIWLAFTIKASKDLIWEAIASNHLIDDIFKDCNKVKVIEENEHNSVVTYYLNILFKKYEYTLNRKFEPEIYRTTWEKKNGDFKQISGFWQIQDTPEAGVFLVTSESFLETGFSVPDWMLNLVKKNKTKELAEDLREWIAKHPDYLVQH